MKTKAMKWMAVALMATAIGCGKQETADPHEGMYYIGVDQTRAGAANGHWEGLGWYRPDDPVPLKFIPDEGFFVSHLSGTNTGKSEYNNSNRMVNTGTRDYSFDCRGHSTMTGVATTFPSTTITGNCRIRPLPDGRYEIIISASADKPLESDCQITGVFKTTSGQIYSASGGIMKKGEISSYATRSWGRYEEIAASGVRGYSKQTEVYGSMIYKFIGIP